MARKHRRLGSARNGKATGQHGYGRRQFDRLVMVEAERRFKCEGIAIEIGIAGPNTGNPNDPSRRRP